MPTRSAWRRLPVVAACLASFPAAVAAPPAAAPAPATHDHHHDHGDHAHPTTLAAGVAELEQVTKSVKDHLAADSRAAADDAVHGLGHLLEDVQGLVRKTPLAADAKAAAAKALDDLFECFDTLDTALHAEPGKGRSPAEVHASVEGRIATALKALRAAADGKPIVAAAPAGVDVAALRGALVLAEEPAGAVSLTAAKDQLSTEPARVTVVGRIGAKGIDPFLADKASFSLLEIPVADAHAAQAGHKPEECPFCKKRAANAPIAAIRFLGPDGREIPVDARKLFGVEAGQDVVIRGTGIFDASLPVQILQITADGIHVRPRGK